MVHLTCKCRRTAHSDLLNNTNEIYTCFSKLESLLIRLMTSVVVYTRN